MNRKGERIRNDIIALYGNRLRKPSNVAKEYPRLYSNARRAFGSWKRALEACEIDYEKSRNNKKWTREKVTNEIKKLHLSGCSLRPNDLRDAGNIRIISAARYHFGSWSKAVKYSGLYYSYERNHTKTKMSNNFHLKKDKYFYTKPINVYFESTVACDLACKHCRAEAIPERGAFELNTDEVKDLLRNVKELGSHIIISGGDPLKRDDLFEILSYAKEIKVPFGVTPTTSPLATYEALKKMKDLGIFALGISLDGATEKTQDSFRGVDGTFENSIRVLSCAKELNIPVQVNTTCTSETISEIEDIYNLIAENYSPPVKRWAIFMLVPVGRGRELSVPSTSEVECLFQLLYEKSKKAPFHITTTEAPYYRVYYILRELENGGIKDEIINRRRNMGMGVRDGNGVIFVSHKGDIYPSGFLPISLGNVREIKLSEIYKNNNILNSLRDPDNFRGKCGVCPFKFICGGSRARAFAVNGDFLEADPLCHFDEEFLQSMKF